MDRAKYVLMVDYALLRLGRFAQAQQVDYASLPFARKLALYMVGLTPPRTRSLRSYLVNPQKARRWTASQSLAAR